MEKLHVILHTMAAFSSWIAFTMVWSSALLLATTTAYVPLGAISRHHGISSPVCQSVLAHRGGSFVPRNDVVHRRMAPRLKLSSKEVAEESTEKEGIEWDKIVKQAKLFWEMSIPYYKDSKAGRWLFAGMVGLTLVNSGVSVAFSYVGKDFW